MLQISRVFAGVAIVAICAGAMAPDALAQNANADRYVLCTFRPQANVCGDVYKQALTDSSPGADAVKAAFDGYGRYVRNASGGLTDDDKRYLSENGIRLPPDLTPEDQAGLHTVLNDPAL